MIDYSWKIQYSEENKDSDQEIDSTFRKLELKEDNSYITLDKIEIDFEKIAKVGT